MCSRTASTARERDSTRHAMRGPHLTLDGDLFGEPLVFGNDGLRGHRERHRLRAQILERHGCLVDPRGKAGRRVRARLRRRRSGCRCDVHAGHRHPTRRDIRRGGRDESHSGGAAHHLVGLDLHTGKIVLDQTVDPPGSTPLTELQRTGSPSTRAGRVRFRGERRRLRLLQRLCRLGSRDRRFRALFRGRSAAGDFQGAVWMGGASPVVDSKGNVWVSAGNGSVKSSTATLTTTVTRCSSSPRTCRSSSTSRLPRGPSDNASDLDLGSTSPALLSDGLVLEVGKAGIGYLLESDVARRHRWRARLGAWCVTELPTAGTR